MLICVFVKISTNPSPRVRSWPWRLHESETQVQGNQRFFFSFRRFEALSSGEKSRKTSGTRVEMSTISVFLSALIPKGLLVQVAVQKPLICDFSVMLRYFSVPQRGATISNLHRTFCNLSTLHLWYSKAILYFSLWHGQVSCYGVRINPNPTPNKQSYRLDILKPFRSL